MPIYGLTDRGMAFPEIGRIRKGGAKVDEHRPGPDLKYFRVVFDAKEHALEEKFHQVFGQEPAEIEITFPFNDFDRQATFFLEAYNSGRMIARSDGKVYLSKLSPKGEVLAVNGVWVAGENKGKPALYDPNVPEYTYTTSNGKTQEVFCKAITRIKVVVPALQRLAYLMLLSSSVYDAMNLSEQLEGLWEMTGGHWAGVPLVLRRKPRQVMCSDQSGKKTYREKSLLSIEAAPRWVEKQLTGMEHNALLLASGQHEQPALPEPALPTRDPEPEDEFDDEPADGEFEDTPASEPELPEVSAEMNELWGKWAGLVREASERGIKVAPFETDNPTFTEVQARFDKLNDLMNAAAEQQEEPAQGDGKRPMKPDQLRQHILAEAEKLKGTKNTTEQMQAVTTCLEYLCKGRGARMEFLANLVQKPITSTKDLPAAVVVALHRYLKPYYNEQATTFLPAADVERFVTVEVTTAHAEWLKENGQETLFG